MKLVGRGVLDAFCRRHADARRWVEVWIADVGAATWATPHDIKQRYPSASFLSGNAVIFNVRGNDYRLETTIAYQTGVIVVRWAGTHADYNTRNKLR